ncbi:GNAT family N-acetyltransferase [Gynuella sunshinyii]|uniref:Acetyltransferase n=1 Tax=Gynuella sunshinyii YC6258 TaxID=1445510 RepID=A0A0C5VDJ8_9GAMM|nr:GNAT family N-acetyltransferase [Gynuella sunshinyii]AJQ92612.1 acetyltransferase [Gynuella sunshinyii YC6258]
MIIQPYQPETDNIPYPLLMLADPDIRRIDEYLANGRLFLGYQQSNDQAVAAAIVNASESTLEITNIATDPSLQGRGYGKQMVAFIVGFARQHGYATLQVGTGNSSLDQLGFYQKCGFRISGIIPDFFIHDDPPIFENGIRCLDMVLLTQSISRLSD